MAAVSDALVNVRADDFVEYFLFKIGVDKYNEHNADCLKRLHSDVLSVVKEHSKDYIWQKDEFNLFCRGADDPPIVDSEEYLPPHLSGVTHYGENIEDEWFIVFLLMELTKKMPGLVARVLDSDGEFLLIEAADHLPNWASPDVCEKRVYIYRGEVHMIPREGTDLDDDGGDDDDECPEEEVMTVTKALARLEASPDETRASPSVQNAILSRIKGYPDKIQELVHQTHAYVPAGVAALLRERPSLIAPAVTAFCHRDPIDMRVCRAMRYFPPETRVMAQVRMTRCLYAMLLHHKYSPDRRTGWHLPPPSSPNYLSHSIGVKLACGFEILASQSKSNNDLSCDKDWIRYKQALTNKGYFKGLLEGSEEYKKLESKAEEFYRRENIGGDQSQTVLSLLDSLDIDLEEMRKAASSLPPPDDDSWMELSQEELEKTLEERYGTRADVPASALPSKLASFLDHISGFEGAEHPPPQQNKDGVPLRPKRAKDDVRDEDNNRVSFDQEAFTCALHNILDFVVPEDSWDLESEGSGMSAYEDEVEMDLSRKKPSQRKKPGVIGNDGSQSELKQYMDQMDRELASTTMGQSFHKKPPPKGMEDSFSDIESFEPVDIDMNALRNILESYQAEMGGAGPASTLLGPMGVRLHEK